MTAARAWLALVDAPAAGATAAAEVHDRATGRSLGWLSAWLRPAKPVRHALRADPAAFDPGGPVAIGSYVLVGAGRGVLFDDPAVQRARQLLHAAPWPWTAATTLVGDAVHFRGSLLAAPADAWPADDPFALVAPALRLHIGPGLVSGGPLRLPAPVIERYAGQPWPQSGF